MRAKSGSWLLSLASKPFESLFIVLLLLLPSQLGKHFWPPYAFIGGLRVDYLSPTLYLSDIIVLLLFIEVFPLLLRRLKIRFIVPLILIFLYLGLVSFYSPWPQSSLLGVLRIVEVIFVGWLIGHFISTKRLFIPSAVALSSAMITTTALSVWQFFLQHSVGGLWYWVGERSFSVLTPGIANANLSGNLILRPYGTFPHPNVLGGYAVILTCYLLYFGVKTSNRLVRSIIIVAICSGILTTIITMSRTAILVLGLILCLWVFKRISKGLRHALFILMGVVLLIGLLYVSGVYTRFSTMRITDEAVVMRAALVKQAAQIFGENQLVGVGVSNFLPSLALQIDPMHTYRNLQPVHSLYLLILVEAGLIGALLFIIGTGVSLYKIYYSRTYRVEKTILFFSLLLLGLTDHYLYTLHQGQLLIAFVLGITLAPFGSHDFTDPEAKNRGILSQRSITKKPVPSSSLKIPRTRNARRKK